MMEDLMDSFLSRRRVLKGMMNGAAVTVALPLLDCFLNDNGSAFADGTPLPVRFGTWFWALGMAQKVFVPQTVGPHYDLPEEIASLAPVKDKINVFTGFDTFKDDTPNMCHYTGWVICMSGSSPQTAGDKPGESIDITVANEIGRQSRFKTLTATATGDTRTTYSYENQTTPSTPEWSATQFYSRLFGPEFQDPNAKVFKPNPKTMVRRSVLSVVMDDIKRVQARVGADDRARVDQYLTGLRHLETQLDQQLTRPEPRAACKAPDAPKEDGAMGSTVEMVSARHRLLTDLMVMAIACDQTRVFNMAYADAQSSITKPGYEKPHHTCTHEEPVDEKLGYQPNASWFTRRAIEEWGYYVNAFSKVKEGDGTLLDNVLIYAFTDTGWARIHSLDNMPMFSAGRAGGKIKSGLHIVGGHSPATRLGLTAMRAVGVNAKEWGTKSNNTSQSITEMMA
jgi:hypothetical protein